MSKIYELPLSYRFARKVVVWALQLYYDEIIVNGTENIPQNGGFIFAPNHRNALMDALAIILVTPKHITTSFLARADIFKNKKVAAFLRFAKIMPAFRIRDGFENLTKNNDVFEECVELIEANHALCIMPEGNQELEHRVRPLVKGIFRVAFSVQQRNKSEQSIQILPVGFDYGDIEKFGKHLIINIGKPINVSNYSDSYSENPAKALNEIKDDLKSRLETLTIHVESENHYDTILSAADFSYSKILKKQGVELTTNLVYNTRKQTVDKLCALEKQQPERLAELEKLCADYDRLLKKNNVKYRNADNKKPVKLILLYFSGLLLSLPVSVLGLIMNVLPFFAPVWIRKLLGVKFEGFFSSIQFVLGLILIPLFYILQSAFICGALSISALYIPFIIVMHLLTGILTFRWYGILKMTIASVRFRFIPQKERKQLKILRKKIYEICS